MKLRIFFIILLSAFFLQNCKSNSPASCPPYPDTIYYNIDPALESLIPYTGYDTLRFMHNNTEINTFIGQGKKYYYNELQPPWEACESDIQKIQGYSTIYKGQNINFNLTFSHYILPYSLGVSYVAINFLGRNIEDSPVGFRPPYRYDTLTIQNHIYHYINFIPRQDIIDTIYYTTKDGIIKIGFRTGDKWEIIK